MICSLGICNYVGAEIDMNERQDRKKLSNTEIKQGGCQDDSKFQLLTFEQISIQSFLVKKNYTTCQLVKRNNYNLIATVFLIFLFLRCSFRCFSVCCNYFMSSYGRNIFAVTISLENTDIYFKIRTHGKFQAF